MVDRNRWFKRLYKIAAKGDSNLVIKYGNLYRRVVVKGNNGCRQAHWKICAREEDRPKVLQENHDIETAGYFGIRKTALKLSHCYYWPASAFHRQSRYYDLRRRDHNLRVGQLVWKRHHILSSAPDAYASKLAPRFEEYFYATVPVTYSVDTSFFETWEDRVKSAFKGINLFSRDLILLPLHLRDYEGGHWALIAVKPKLNLIRALDSLGHPRTKEMCVILEFLERNAAERKVLFDRNVWTFGKPQMSAPNNGTLRNVEFSYARTLNSCQRGTHRRKIPSTP
ncbi:hypothetical protein J6590_030950 [Homalodisca vitripennis]|nr:hypothetical protein J6590_030950 [Homalodisca vitripennis]